MKFIARTFGVWILFNIFNVIAVRGTVRLAELVVAKGYADADMIEQLKNIKKKYKM